MNGFIFKGEIDVEVIFNLSDYGFDEIMDFFCCGKDNVCMFLVLLKLFLYIVVLLNMLYIVKNWVFESMFGLILDFVMDNDGINVLV